MKSNKGTGKNAVGPPLPKNTAGIGKGEGKCGGYLAKAAARKQAEKMAARSIDSKADSADGKAFTQPTSNSTANSLDCKLVLDGDSVPTIIIVRGIDCESGLNGTYEKNGKFRGTRIQWMKPNSRCYIRWTQRERWEIYVSHHPAGTTYFYTENWDSDCPPATGWKPTEFAMPHENPVLCVPSRPLQLWGNRACPFVHRVRIAIIEKGLQEFVEEFEVDVIGDKDHVFADIFSMVLPNSKHRRATIPMLRHRSSFPLDTDPLAGVEKQTAVSDLTLVESKVIVQYLDDMALDEEFIKTEEATSSPLLPKSAAQKAILRLFIDTFERELSPCLHSILSATDMGALWDRVQTLERGISALDGFLAAHAVRGGPFFCGEMFSLAEVLLAPDLIRLFTLAPHFRPRLLQILGRGRPVDGAKAGMPTDFERNSLGALGPLLLQRAPTFVCWAAAVFERPSVIQSYWIEEVIAIKQRAVPAWREVDGESLRV